MFNLINFCQEFIFLKKGMQLINEFTFFIYWLVLPNALFTMIHQECLLGNAHVLMILFKVNGFSTELDDEKQVQLQGVAICLYWLKNILFKYF